jgi:acyl-CoA synthetase (AMP-forming)/AMP-acid ligase II
MNKMANQFTRDQEVGTTAARHEQTIHQLVQSWAARTPQAAAFWAPERHAVISYAALLQQIEDTKKTLNDFGIGRNDAVAVVLPNGIEMATAFVTISSAATSAPLNPAYKADEFDFYLSDLDAKALVIQAGMESAVIAVARQHSIPIVELIPGGRHSPAIFSSSAPKGLPGKNSGFAQAQDAALILHTSGTTARPKRVELTHSHLAASANSITETLQLTEQDRCLNVMPLFHIHGLVGALLSTMMAGGSVICSPGFDAEIFFRSLEEYRATWYTAVPPIHQAVLTAAEDRRETSAGSSLRFIRSCSAALPPVLMTQLEQFFGVPVIEAYGMTEAAHQLACNPLPPRQRKPRSVGIPTETEIRVVNSGFGVCGPGEKGEIIVRGRSIITAYAGGTAMGETNFKDGWFRTGDQGYFDVDGYLYLTGRLKEIINRGGEKISPKEIDEVLLDHPEVSQAAAFPIPHPTLGEDIAAMVVLRASAQASEQSLREYLLDRLAEFKVPSRLFMVDQIPKTATGKVNRARLAAMYADEASGAILADTALEKTVTEIYRDVLGVQEIGRTDNFFVLGGDSLRAGQVINRVRALLGLNLTIGTIFRKASVAELAEEVLRMSQSTEKPAGEEVEKA